MSTRTEDLRTFFDDGPGATPPTLERPRRPGRTPALQATWVDPGDVPFEPVPRPGNPATARLVTWLALGCFGVALLWLIVPALDTRVATRHSVVLDDGVLTAQPVQLAPVAPAVVTELLVGEGDGVLNEGSPIARLEGPVGDDGRAEVSEIVAPFDARFVSIDTLAGGVVMPGTPVATVYDPARMYVIVSVTPETLELLRTGMRVELTSDAVAEPIGGEVMSAVPLLGTDHAPTTASLVNVRIRPDADAVVDLLPGIRFEVEVDLTSAEPGAPRLTLTAGD